MVHWTPAPKGDASIEIVSGATGAAVLTTSGEVLEETQRLRAGTKGAQAAEIVNATLQDAAKRFAPLLVVKGIEDWAKR